MGHILWDGDFAEGAGVAGRVAGTPGKGHDIKPGVRLQCSISGHNERPG